MRRIRLSLCLTVIASAIVMAVPFSAGAAAIYQYDVENLGPAGQVAIDKLDTSKKTTIRYLRSGVLLHRVTNAAGPGSAYIAHEIDSGDVIEVYQYPAGDPNLVEPPPPGVLPVETFPVPALTINAAAGNQVITGTATDGWDAYVFGQHPCPRGPYDDLVAVRTPGAYSATFAFPMQEGSPTSVELKNASGDEVSRNNRLPGDGRCIDVDALVGISTSTTPFHVEVNGLDPAIGTTRTVLRRSGAALDDDNDDYLSMTTDKRPLPGDVVEVYRPHDAAAPAYTYTLPQFSGVVDANGNLAAIDVEAGSMIQAWACRRHGCSPKDERFSRKFAAGRTMFDFGQPDGASRPFDILSSDYAGGTWSSADERIWIEFELTPGDLVPPVGKPKLGSRLKVSKLRKGLKFKLNSNEPGSVSAALTVPKMPKAGSAAARRPVTIATVAARNVIAGNNTLSLKPTKKGKAAFKRINRGKSVKATLTITLKDAAGNTAALTKNVKISG